MGFRWARPSLLDTLRIGQVDPFVKASRSSIIVLIRLIANCCTESTVGVGWSPYAGEGEWAAVEPWMGSKSVMLERKWRGEREGRRVRWCLSFPSSPSNKCPWVHQLKYLQLLKWSHSTDDTAFPDGHCSHSEWEFVLESAMLAEFWQSPQKAESTLMTGLNSQYSPGHSQWTHGKWYCNSAILSINQQLLHVILTFAPVAKWLITFRWCERKWNQLSIAFQ